MVPKRPPSPGRQLGQPGGSDGCGGGGGGRGGVVFAGQGPVSVAGQPTSSLGLDSGPPSKPLIRRLSVYERLVSGPEVASAQRRACCGLLFFAVLLFLAATKGLTLELVRVVNRARIELPRNADATLPSLNLFHYDDGLSYPLFDEFPTGLKRKIMPQMPERRPGVRDPRVDSDVWRAFYSSVETRGGSIGEEIIDLRFTKPLQSELSGHIIFNVLFGENGSRIREKLEMNPRFFSEHIVLLRTPTNLVGKSGERIPMGALFVLDGHHTNEVIKHCSHIQHTSLRHGYDDQAEHHICGEEFRTRQTVIVINGLDPLVVIDIALDSGASSGHGLMHFEK